MLTFSENYFKDELRSDFYVPEMMKRAWAAHLKILSELQALFKKYGLIYFADFGTLLGAVRHRGIIPWDDDIDISMPRADFMKFIDHADELPDYLRVLSVYNSDTFTNFHAVATNNTADLLEWDQERFDRFYKCPFICYIDIFPMDYVPRDPEQKKLRQNLYSYAYKTVYDCVSVENSSFGGKLITLEELRRASGETAGEAIALLHQIEELIGFLTRFYGNKCRIDEKKPLRNQLCLAAEYIAHSVSERDADRVDYAPHMAYSRKDLSRRKEWIKETKDIPFEVMEIAVPNDYHSVLVSRFGEKYMTPRHLPSTHEYPYYRTQIEVLVGGDTGEMYVEDGVRAPILEAVDTLREAHGILEEQVEHIARDQSDSAKAVAQRLLADLQDGAAGIGEAIENIREDSTAVAELTRYCEGIFELYQGLDGNSDIVAKERSLTGLLDRVKGLVIKEIHPDIPEDWEKILYLPGGGKKKLIIYGLSAIELVSHGDRSIDKINRSLKVFEDNKQDICVMLCVSDGVKEFLEKCELAIAGAFGEILDRVGGLDFCILEHGERLSLAVSLADAYYGDKCPLMDVVKRSGIPIMIQNYDLD